LKFWTVPKLLTTDEIRSPRIDSYGAHLFFQLISLRDERGAPAPDWLQTLAARCARTPDHMLGGRALNALPDNFFQRPVS
jgi:hypothetical protein